MPQRGRRGSDQHGAGACCDGSQGLPCGGGGLPREEVGVCPAGWNGARPKGNRGLQHRGFWGLSHRGTSYGEGWRSCPTRGLGSCTAGTPSAGRGTGDWVILTLPERAKRGAGARWGPTLTPLLRKCQARNEQPRFRPGPTMRMGVQNWGSGTVLPSRPPPNAGPGSHPASMGARP